MDHIGSSSSSSSSSSSRWLRLLVRCFIWQAFSYIKSSVLILNKAVFSLGYSLVTGLTPAFRLLDVTDR